MLDEHLTPRHAALIGFNLFDHILDASAVPIGPRGTQVLPVVLVLLSFDGKLGRVEGSLEHPLPFSRLKRVIKQIYLAKLVEIVNDLPFLQGLDWNYDLLC